MRFCGNFYFKLRYCGFIKPRGFAVFRNFRVIPKRFFFSVVGLYVFLCGFFGIRAPLRPPLSGEFLA